MCSVCQSLAGGSSDQELRICGRRTHSCGAVGISVDTTPTCTREDAHFSREHIAVRNSCSTTLFQRWAHRIGSSNRNLCCAFLCTHFHLVCHVLVRWSALSIPFGHVLTYMLFVKTLSILNLVWWKWTKLLCWLLGHSDPMHNISSEVVRPQQLATVVDQLPKLSTKICGPRGLWQTRLDGETSG